MLLDADDMWLPKKVERMVEFAAKRPTAGMLYHRFQNIDRNGRKTDPPQPYYLIDGDYRSKFIRRGGGWWCPITAVMTLRTELIKRALPIPTYAVREGADNVIADYCVLTTEIASSPDVLTLRRLHGSNLYAEGRANYHDRPKEVREGDIRRVEWRMFTMKQIMDRIGERFNIDVGRNEWRMMNLYWLNRAPLWKALWTSLFYLSMEGAGLKFRWGRFKWLLAMKRAYRRDRAG
jgi:hypothetical protein